MACTRQRASVRRPALSFLLLVQRTLAELQQRFQEHAKFSSTTILVHPGIPFEMIEQSRGQHGAHDQKGRRYDTTTN